VRLLFSKIFLTPVSWRSAFALTVIIICGCWLSGCGSLFYFPAREELIDRTKLPVKPVDVYIPTSDGEKLHAWQFKPKQSIKNPAVFFQFNGNAENQTTHFIALYSAVRRGHHLLTFDYRGYGASTGDPSPLGTVEDGKAVLRWVSQAFPKTPLIVFGQSLGGAIAMRSLEELGTEVPVHWLVLDSTFMSYRSVARSTMSKSWITWLFQPLAWLIVDNSAAPMDKLDQLAPYKKLVVHGNQDPVVAFALGQALFAKLPEPKEFWEIEGGGHIDFMLREDGRFAEKFFQALDSSLLQ
jgi:uncharacterized protein